MKRIAMYGTASGSIGAILAVALLAYDYLFLTSPSGTNIAGDVDAVLFFTLCPSSLALMALENVHGPRLAFGLAMIILANAALYGVVGFLVGGCESLYNRLIGKGQSTSH